MEKRKVKIREGSWLARIAAWRLKSGKMALVFGHTIHLHRTTRAEFLSRPAWVRHELKHVAQYERLGVPGFIWQYAIESARNGYWQNRLEVEARLAEQDDLLFEQFEIVP